MNTMPLQGLTVFPRGFDLADDPFLPIGADKILKCLFNFIRGTYDDKVHARFEGFIFRKDGSNLLIEEQSGIFVWRIRSPDNGVRGSRGIKGSQIKCQCRIPAGKIDTPLSYKPSHCRIKACHMDTLAEIITRDYRDFG
ncbi:MAG: hypothetical protein BWY93_02341 [Euryarchaeota archaeon ADurb.BinA087]|nr:MAG: hypothetical protein BWY93_02341 [Euryarchaeota archaeon ADurb.BinA087]